MAFPKSVLFTTCPRLPFRTRGCAVGLVSNTRFCSRNAGSTDALFDAVTTGDVQRLEGVLKGSAPDAVNTRSSDRGLTPLMLSSIRGHYPVVETLLKHNCDTTLRSPAGQTAVELAAFYRRRAVHERLSAIPGAHRAQGVYFCHNPLSRNSHLRSKPDVIASLMSSDTARYLLFNNEVFPIIYKGKNQTESSRNPSARPKRQKPVLLTVDYKKLAEHIDSQNIRDNTVFLGQDGEADDSPPYFAVDVSAQSNVQLFHPEADVITHWRQLMTLSPRDAGLVAQARWLLDWNRRHQYCPTCGEKTEGVESGYKRKCTNRDCDTYSGVHNTDHPRVDPSMICLVVSPDQRSCLLAHGRRHPPNVFSCLAGYVEPGESIEMSCEREIQEEVGVQVRDVEYVVSQPWPMPSVLMIGCTAVATDTELHVDQDELEDARWFPRDEVVALITRTHRDGLFAPPTQAVAHQLIKQWLLKTAF